MLEDLYKLVKDVTNLLLESPLGVIFVVSVLSAYGILDPARLFPYMLIYIVIGLVKDYRDFLKRREQENKQINK